jgi:hypothetical protein
MHLQAKRTHRNRPTQVDLSASLGRTAVCNAIVCRAISIKVVCTFSSRLAVVGGACAFDSQWAVKVCIFAEIYELSLIEFH